MVRCCSQRKYPFGTRRCQLLNSSSIWFCRVIGVLLCVAAIGEKILFGTLFVPYVLTLVSVSIILSKNASVLNCFPKAFLFISFYFEVILVAGVFIPVFKSEVMGNLIVAMPMMLSVSLAFNRISTNAKPRNYSLALFTGPTIFISFATFAYTKFGGVLTWAMSGDSRNHVYQMRAVIDRGGIVLFNGYPALANGIASLLGGWQYNSDAVGGGHLGTEIHILGLTSALSLVICSVFSGLFIENNPRKGCIQVSYFVAVISLIPISQFFLNTYFTEGFFPSSFSLAVLLAVLYEVTRSNSTSASKFLSCIMGSALILLTFPLLITVLLPCFFLTFYVHFSSKSLTASLIGQSMRKIQLLVWLIIPVLLIEIESKVPSVKTYVYLHLNNYGRISPIDNWGLWALTLSAFLALIFASRKTESFSALTFIIGTVSIQFSIILDRLLEADYYLNKFIWLSTSLMLILNMVLAAIFFSAANTLIKKLIPSFVFMALFALATIPLLQDFPLKPNLFTMVSSPKYPSIRDAHLITDINSKNPRSIFWRVSADYEATQIIDIWMTLGFDFDKGAFLWGYNSDVFSLDSVCDFAKKNQPATIWVVSKEVQTLARALCNTHGVLIKVIEM